MLRRLILLLILLAAAGAAAAAAGAGWDDFSADIVNCDLSSSLRYGNCSLVTHCGRHQCPDAIKDVLKAYAGTTMIGFSNFKRYR